MSSQGPASGHVLAEAKLQRSALRLAGWPPGDPSATGSQRARLEDQRTGQRHGHGHQGHLALRALRRSAHGNEVSEPTNITPPNTEVAVVLKEKRSKLKEWQPVGSMQQDLRYVPPSLQSFPSLDITLLYALLKGYIPHCTSHVEGVRSSQPRDFAGLSRKPRDTSHPGEGGGACTAPTNIRAHAAG